MNALILSICISLWPQAAHADLKSNFARITREEKGPFGLNMLQGTTERVTVTSGRSPNGHLFQAAYRNSSARVLVEQDSFYTGNLFTTNYYELMGEFVYNNKHGDHPVDHAALQGQGQYAIAKAALMAQHWVLEKQYIELLPGSVLAKAFKYRGISGSEFELAYANHFFNFYLGAIENEYQYLPAFLLASKSPIQGSASLDKARDMVAKAYDYQLERLGTGDPSVRALFNLRNSIHNQLSPAVVKEIDAFFKNYPFYLAEGNTYLGAIRKIIVEYYSFTAAKLSSQAEKSGLRDIKAAADRITAQGVNAGNLLELSRIVAAWRGKIGDRSQLSESKRAPALVVLTQATRFLNKELSGLKQVKNAQVTEAVLNTIYTEGFLIKDNWEYFKGSIASTDAAQLLADVIDVAGAGGTLEEAFKPAYAQWLEIEPRMQYFLDNTLKSSALNTASITIEKLRR